MHNKYVKLPFITIIKVREMMYSDDNSNVVNSINSDLEDCLKRIIVFNKYYKYYDCYCFSSLTDNLPYYRNELYIKKRYNLKSKKIISFRDFKTFNNGGDIDE